MHRLVGDGREWRQSVVRKRESLCQHEVVGELEAGELEAGLWASMREVEGNEMGGREVRVVHCDCHISCYSGVM